MMKKTLFAALFSVLCNVLFDLPLLAMTNQERIEDAHTIINLFYRQYAPVQWKKDYLGIDFNEISGKFLKSAANVASDKDFYNAAALFVGSFRDGHTGYKIPSTFFSGLPFDVDYVEGKFLVNGIAASYFKDKGFPEGKYPINKGDEIVAIGDRSLEDILEDIARYRSVAYEEVDMKKNAYFITNRPQSIFPYVPTGKVDVVFIPKDSGSEEKISLEWITKGFDLEDAPPKSAILNMSKLLGLSFGSKSEENRNQFAGNSNRRMEPFFGLWNNFKKRDDKVFLSGVIPIGDYKVGFLRIDSWSLRNDLPPWEEVVDFIAGEIRYFAENSDALIIDQTDNSGGAGCLANALASFFTAVPRPEIKDQLRANRKNLVALEKDLLDANSADKERYKFWVQEVQKAVANMDLLTPPVPTCTPSGMVLPPRDSETKEIIGYYKPVLLLDNEASFSASELFAALLQDWGVATIFGKRTGGGGGFRIDADYIGNSEMKITLTGSLGYREKEVVTEDGVKTHYIENVGVLPDIKYEPTLKDYLDGYQDYRETVDKAVLNLIEDRCLP